MLLIPLKQKDPQNQIYQRSQSIAASSFPNPTSPIPDDLDSSLQSNTSDQQLSNTRSSTSQQSLSRLYPLQQTPQYNTQQYSQTTPDQQQSFQDAKGSVQEQVSNIPTIDFWSQPNVGIPNIGNTCYLNSAMQGLTYSAAFTSELLNSPFASQDSQFSLYKIDEKQSYQMNPKVQRQLKSNLSQSTNLSLTITGAGAQTRKNDYFNWFALARAVITEMLSLRINDNSRFMDNHTTQDMEQYNKSKYSSSSSSYFDRSISSCVPTSNAQKVQSQLGHVNTHLIGYGQQDSHEALVAILDSLHEVTFDVNNLNIDQFMIQKFSDDDQETEIEEENEVIKLNESRRSSLTQSKKSLGNTVASSSKSQLKRTNSTVLSTPSTMSRDAFNKVWEEYLRLRGSYVAKNIMGLSATGVFCKHCGNQRHSYQPFTVLSLNLPIVQGSSSYFSQKSKVKCSIIDLLKNYSEVSDIEGLKCEFCRHTSDGFHFLFLAHWPKVLILQLNRFAGGVGYGFRKDTTPVTIPDIIKPDDIKTCFESSRFLLSASDHLVPPYEKYQLTAVINHSGSMGGGHYTCCGRLSNGKWMNHSDSFSSEGHVPTTNSTQSSDIMLKLLISVLALSLSQACTNLIVTKGASAEGYNTFTYAADSTDVFGEVKLQAAARYPPGSKRKIFEWITDNYLGEINETEYSFH
ncbi:MAG: hypothetical protein EZS28_017261 [Streblomastix strix]|uniref:Ubiquitin carboxyl-terminal hydrolase n=1 Tax=Streblomastix strix TaxID=222440 RepID=A0A5J4VXZ2_9EUKA|nr:MAG: hypothetical protein EZS28_017261 [Streblomastix strix]